ncbi:hypothetical protein SNEBB_002440 [Seison nebaliae]|nr:hypothetical protein SNEBB_002440 [Seison nebaliae]
MMDKNQDYGSSFSSSSSSVIPSSSSQFVNCSISPNSNEDYSLISKVSSIYEKNSLDDEEKECMSTTVNSDDSELFIPKCGMKMNWRNNQLEKNKKILENNLIYSALSSSNSSSSPAPSYAPFNIPFVHSSFLLSSSLAYSKENNEKTNKNEEDQHENELMINVNNPRLQPSHNPCEIGRKYLKQQLTSYHRRKNYRKSTQRKQLKSNYKENDKISSVTITTTITTTPVTRTIDRTGASLLAGRGTSNIYENYCLRDNPSNRRSVINSQINSFPLLKSRNHFDDVDDEWKKINRINDLQFIDDDLNESIYSLNSTNNNYNQNCQFIDENFSYITDFSEDVPPTNSSIPTENNSLLIDEDYSFKSALSFDQKQSSDQLISRPSSRIKDEEHSFNYSNPTTIEIIKQEIIDNDDNDDDDDDDDESNAIDNHLIQFTNDEINLNKYQKRNMPKRQSEAIILTVKVHSDLFDKRFIINPDNRREHQIKLKDDSQEKKISIECPLKNSDILVKIDGERVDHLSQHDVRKVLNERKTSLLFTVIRWKTIQRCANNTPTNSSTNTTISNVNEMDERYEMENDNFSSLISDRNEKSSRNIGEKKKKNKNNNNGELEKGKWKRIDENRLNIGQYSMDEKASDRQKLFSSARRRSKKRSNILRHLTDRIMRNGVSNEVETANDEIELEKNGSNYSTCLTHCRQDDHLEKITSTIASNIHRSNISTNKNTPILNTMSLNGNNETIDATSYIISSTTNASSLNNNSNDNNNNDNNDLKLNDYDREYIYLLQQQYHHQQQQQQLQYDHFQHEQQQQLYEQEQLNSHNSNRSNVKGDVKQQPQQQHQQSFQHCHQLHCDQIESTSYRLNDVNSLLNPNMYQDNSLHSPNIQQISKSGNKIQSKNHFQHLNHQHNGTQQIVNFDCFPQYVEEEQFGGKTSSVPQQIDNTTFMPIKVDVLTDERQNEMNNKIINDSMFNRNYDEIESVERHNKDGIKTKLIGTIRSPNVVQITPLSNHLTISSTCSSISSTTTILTSSSSSSSTTATTSSSTLLSSIPSFPISNVDYKKYHSITTLSNPVCCGVESNKMITPIHHKHQLFNKYLRNYQNNIISSSCSRHYSRTDDELSTLRTFRTYDDVIPFDDWKYNFTISEDEQPTSTSFSFAKHSVTSTQNTHQHLFKKHHQMTSELTGNTKFSPREHCAPNFTSLPHSSDNVRLPNDSLNGGNLRMLPFILETDDDNRNDKSKTNEIYHYQSLPSLMMKVNIDHHNDTKGEKNNEFVGDGDEYREPVRLRRVYSDCGEYSLNVNQLLCNMTIRDDINRRPSSRNKSRKNYNEILKNNAQNRRSAIFSIASTAIDRLIPFENIRKSESAKFNNSEHFPNTRDCHIVHCTTTSSMISSTPTTTTATILLEKSRNENNRKEFYGTTIKSSPSMTTATTKTTTLCSINDNHHHHHHHHHHRQNNNSKCNLFANGNKLQTKSMVIPSRGTTISHHSTTPTTTITVTSSLTSSTSTMTKTTDCARMNCFDLATDLKKKQCQSNKKSEDDVVEKKEDKLPFRNGDECFRSNSVNDCSYSGKEQKIPISPSNQRITTNPNIVNKTMHQNKMNKNVKENHEVYHHYCKNNRHKDNYHHVDQLQVGNHRTRSTHNCQKKKTNNNNEAHEKEMKNDHQNKNDNHLENDIDEFDESSCWCMNDLCQMDTMDEQHHNCHRHYSSNKQPQLNKLCNCNHVHCTNNNKNNNNNNNNNDHLNDNGHHFRIRSNCDLSHHLTNEMIDVCPTVNRCAHDQLLSRNGMNENEVCCPYYRSHLSHHIPTAATAPPPPPQSSFQQDKHLHFLKNSMTYYRPVNNRMTNITAQPHKRSDRPNNYSYDASYECQKWKTDENRKKPNLREHHRKECSSVEHVKKDENMNNNNNNNNSHHKNNNNSYDENKFQYLTVQLKILPQDRNGFGFTIQPNHSHQHTRTMKIEEVLSDSAASRDGRLRSGDEIIGMNGQSMIQLSSTETFNLLKRSIAHRNIVLHLKRNILPSSMKNGENNQRNNNFRDYHRTTSICNDNTNNNHCHLVNNNNNSNTNNNINMANSKIVSSIQVTLHKKARQTYGFQIKTIECPNGYRHFIRKIIDGSIADKARRIYPNDELIAVHGKLVVQLSHDQLNELLCLHSTYVVLTLSSSTIPNSHCAQNELESDSLSSQHQKNRNDQYEIDEEHEHFTSTDDSYGDLENDGSVIQLDRNLYSIILRRGKKGFGFSIRGGSDFNSNIFVLVTSITGAAFNKLQVGDIIMNINGYDTSSLTHEQATQLIRGCHDTLKLLVQRTGMPPPSADDVIRAATRAKTSAATLRFDGTEPSSILLPTSFQSAVNPFNNDTTQQTSFDYFNEYDRKPMTMTGGTAPPLPAPPNLPLYNGEFQKLACGHNTKNNNTNLSHSNYLNCYHNMNKSSVTNNTMNHGNMHNNISDDRITIEHTDKNNNNNNPNNMDSFMVNQIYYTNNMMNNQNTNIINNQFGMKNNLLNNRARKGHQSRDVSRCGQRGLSSTSAHSLPRHYDPCDGGFCVEPLLYNLDNK